MAEQVPESLDDAFEDLDFRFLLNLPEQELNTAERLFFQIEQAYWFYEDFLADKHPHLKHFKKFDVFAQEMFIRCETLEPLKHKFEDFNAKFKDYRRRIPVFGIIMLNKELTRVLRDLG